MIEYISKNGYFGFNKDGDFIALGYDIAITAVKKNLDGDKVTLQVVFEVSEEVVNTELNYGNMKEVLNEKGYAVSHNNEHHIKEYLQQQANELMINSVYTNLGWCRLDNKISFKGYKLKSLDNKQADYNGNYDIQPRGKLDDFQKYLKKLIIGNTPLEVAVTLGLSACVVGYIRLHTPVSNLICSIHGKTTTGKTTAAKLAISMGGNPYCGDDKISLAGTCSTTANAMYGQLRGNHGYPVLFDELASIGKSADIEQMLYCIAEGEDKKRMTKSGDIRLLEKWSTAVIFTSEHPMLDSEVESGLNVRVLDFADVKWTKNAKQARNIELFSKAFAGLGIDILASYMLNNASGIYQSYESYMSEISESLKVNNSLKVRTSKPIAILKLTAELASKAFGVQFNVNEIVKFVTEAAEKDAPIPEWLDMYEHLLQRIVAEKHLFETKRPKWSYKEGEGYDQTDMGYSCYGYIHYEKRSSGVIEPKYCVVLTEKVKDWCKKYKNYKANLKELSKNGLLARNSSKDDRYVIKEYINKASGSMSCYKIYYQSSFSDSLSELNTVEEVRENAEKALLKMVKILSFTNIEDCKDVMKNSLIDIGKFMGINCDKYDELKREVANKYVRDYDWLREAEDEILKTENPEEYKRIHADYELRRLIASSDDDDTPSTEKTEQSATEGGENP